MSWVNLIVYKVETGEVEKVVGGIYDNERDTDIKFQDLEPGHYQCYIEADWN